MHRIFLLGILLIATLIPGSSFGQSSVNSEIALAGKLRVAMNAGTVVLLTRTPDGKITGGVGLELAKFIAKKLEMVLELAPYPDSNSYTQSLARANGILALR